MKKAEDFGEWYNEAVDRAGVSDKRYPIKGMNVWTPYGWALMRRIDEFIRLEMAATGHDEVCFPLLIPESEFKKESMHIKGFESDVFWVTHAGLNPLDIKLILRPTSETAMYPMFSLWIRSHADLPLKTFQIVNVFRYETKVTRTFIRVREIHFFESHTCHSTFEEAEAQIREDLEIMGRLARKLALPYLLCRRPDWDKFAGAHYSIGVDVYVAAAGRSLQVGGIHQYKENFAKAYDIKFETEVSQFDLAKHIAAVMEKMGYEHVKAHEVPPAFSLKVPDVEATKEGKRVAVAIKRKIAGAEEGSEAGAALGTLVSSAGGAKVILACYDIPGDIADSIRGQGIEVWDGVKVEAHSKTAGIEPPQMHKHVHQTTYGMSERLIGTIVAVHGDDRGLILPPQIAPIQLVIVPIPEKGQQEIIAGEARKLNEELARTFRVRLDERDIRPGNKFYEWEEKGVPLRLEIGPRDLKEGVVTLVRRDTMEKSTARRDGVADAVRKTLDAVQSNLLELEEKRMLESIADVSDISGFKEALNRAGWCGAEECGHEIENMTGMAILGTPVRKVEYSGACVVCGKPTTEVIYVCRTF